MPRPAYPSATLSASVRARLGLSREELSDLLGVGVSQIGHVEAGRRSFSVAAQSRLRRLDQLLSTLPSPAPEPADATPQSLTIAEAAVLRRRLRACRRKLKKLQEQQETRPAQAAAVKKRQQALTALSESLTNLPPDPTEPGLDSVREQAWFELVMLGTDRVARRQLTPIGQSLLDLRLRLLTEEVNALEKLLEVQ